jgi:hypothetical protein
VDVYNYFSAVTDDNDLSYSAHVAIACFLAACHMTMLNWLLEMHSNAVAGGPDLLARWHAIMERGEQITEKDREQQKNRTEFFQQVVELAETVSHYHLSPSRKFISCWQLKGQGYPKPKSPRRKNGVEEESKDGVEEESKDIEKVAGEVYTKHARKATEELVNFIKTISPGQSVLCVTYFDEADALGLRFWILLRLLSHQREGTLMWYVFMATKSSVSYFSPLPKKRESSYLPPF